MERGGPAYTALVAWLRTFSAEQQQSPDSHAEGEGDGGSMVFDESSLNDALFLHNCLGAALAPDLFDPSAVKAGSSSNWMLRRQNLKKFANGLCFFTEGFLGRENNYQVEDFLSEIDLTRIAKDDLDSETSESGGDIELAKLCQLALGAAVHSPDHRESHVQAIMELDEHIQRELMHLIGDVASFFARSNDLDSDHGDGMSVSGSEGNPSPLSSPRLSSNIRASRDSEGSFDWSLSAVGENNSTSAASLNPVKAGRAANGSDEAMADAKLENLKRQNRALIMERDDLLDRIQELEQKGGRDASKSESVTSPNLDREPRDLNGDPNSSIMSEGNEAISAAEATAAAGKRDVARAEKDRDAALAHVADMEEKMETLVEELSALRNKANETESMLSSQLRQQADELEIAREQLGGLHRTQSALEKAKSKLEEIPSLKRQLREAEERCDEYMEKTIDQESMLESIPALKKKLADSKDKIVDLHASVVKAEARLEAKKKETESYKQRSAEATVRTRQMEQELRACKEELAAVKSDAKEAEEAHAEEIQSFAGIEASIQQNGPQGLTLDMSSTSSRNDVRSLKEKVARLERENKRLKQSTRHAENSGDSDRKADSGGFTQEASAEDLAERLEDALRLQKRYQQDSSESMARAEALQVELDMLKSNITNANGGERSSESAVSEEIVTKKVQEAVSAADEAAAKRYKLVTERLERMKRKHEEQLRLNADLRQSVIELEQNIGDMREEQERKIEQEAGETSANAVVIDGLKKSLREREVECDSLAMAKEKLEKYVQRALQATQVKYKAAVQTLQSQSEEKSKKLRDANAKVSHLVVYLYFHSCDNSLPLTSSQFSSTHQCVYIRLKYCRIILNKQNGCINVRSD